jgi:hypothetical protein
VRASGRPLRGLLSMRNVVVVSTRSLMHARAHRRKGRCHGGAGRLCIRRAGGASPSGKAAVFGTAIPRFESWRPSHPPIAGGRLLYFWAKAGFAKNAPTWAKKPYCAPSSAQQRSSKRHCLTSLPVGKGIPRKRLRCSSDGWAAATVEGACAGCG